MTPFRLLAAALLTGGALTAQLPTGPAILPAHQVTTTEQVYDLDLADFDEDGVPDLLVHNPITVFLGRGDGTFDLAQTIEVPAFPQSADHQLTVVDLDDDGHQDVVVKSPSILLAHPPLNVYFGSGDGTLPEPVALGPPAPWFEVDFFMEYHAGDVDLDGDVDLVAGDENIHQFFVFANDGNQSFTLIPGPIANEHLFTNELADVTHDGVPDLVWIDKSGASRFLSTATGAGDGTFGATVSSPVPGSPFGIALGDLEGDGTIDAVFVEGVVDVDTRTHAAPGDGAGSFGPAVLVGPGGSRDPELAHVDDDGALDIVTGTDAGGLLGVRWGLGDGSFEGTHVLGTAVRPARVIVSGDLNGDGRLDLVAAESNDTAATVYLGAGGRRFEGDERRQLPDPGGLVAADFTGDGLVDAAVGHESVGRVVVYPGLGDGSLGVVIGSSIPGAAALIADGDLDADGVRDLLGLGGTPYGLVGYLGAGDGKFSAAAVLGLPITVKDAVLFDADSDGLPDVALVDDGLDVLEVLLGQGDGTFAADAAPPLTGPLKVPRDLHASDLDLDGFVDLLVADDWFLFGGAFVSFAVGDGTYGALQPIDPVPQPTKRVVTGDLDGNGFPDVVTDLFAYANLDGSSFGARIAHPETRGDHVLHDLDGDGHLDLLATRAPLVTEPSPDLTVFQGVGDGSFGTQRSHHPPPPTLGEFSPVALGRELPSIAVADFDQNQWPDVALLADSIPLVPAETVSALHLLPNLAGSLGIVGAGSLFAATGGSVNVLGGGFDLSTEVSVGGVQVDVLAVAAETLTVALGPSEPGAFDVAVTGGLGTSILGSGVSRWPVLDASQPTLGGTLDWSLDNGANGVWVLAYSPTVFAEPIPLGPGIWYSLWLAQPVVIASGFLTGEAAVAAGSIPIPNQPGLAGATVHLQGFAQQLGVSFSPDLSLTNRIVRTLL